MSELCLSLCRHPKGSAWQQPQLPSRRCVAPCGLLQRVLQWMPPGVVKASWDRATLTGTVMLQDKAPAKPVNPLFEKREKRFGEPLRPCSTEQLAQNCLSDEACVEQLWQMGGGCSGPLYMCTCVSASSYGGGRSHCMQLMLEGVCAGVGGTPAPKHDLHRFVKWPKYVRIQRQRRVLNQRLKVRQCILPGDVDCRITTAGPFQMSVHLM